MKRVEEIVGNVFATILIGVVICSVCYSTFVMLFRDGRGLGFYGGRGEMYMSE